jgi:hypothetical protein
MENSDKVANLSMRDVLLGLQHVFQILIKKWWIILILGFIGSSAGITYAYYKRAEYQSRLTFALEDNSGGLSGALNLAAEFGFSIGSSGKTVFQGENILAILGSRKIIEGVLLTIDTVNDKPITLIDEYISIEKEGSSKIKKKSDILSSVKYPAGIKIDELSYLQDSVLFVVYSNIVQNQFASKRIDKRYNLFEVSFTFFNERFAKIFTERAVDEAIRLYTEIRTKKGLESVQVLEERVGSLRGNVNSAISSRAIVQDANRNPVFNDQNATIQKKQLDITTYGQAYSELFKNLEVARFQLLQDAPLLQIIDEPRYPLKRIKPGKLKTGLQWGVIMGFLGVFLILSFHYLKAPKPGN